MVHHLPLTESVRGASWRESRRQMAIAASLVLKSLNEEHACVVCATTINGAASLWMLLNLEPGAARFCHDHCAEKLRSSPAQVFGSFSWHTAYCVRLTLSSDVCTFSACEAISSFFCDASAPFAGQLFPLRLDDNCVRYASLLSVLNTQSNQGSAVPPSPSLSDPEDLEGGSLSPVTPAATYIEHAPARSSFVDRTKDVESAATTSSSSVVAVASSLRRSLRKQPSLNAALVTGCLSEDAIAAKRHSESLARSIVARVSAGESKEKIGGSVPSSLPVEFAANAVAGGVDGSKLSSSTTAPASVARALRTASHMQCRADAVKASLVNDAALKEYFVHCRKQDVWDFIQILRDVKAWIVLGLILRPHQSPADVDAVPNDESSRVSVARVEVSSFTVRVFLDVVFLLYQ
jgi:hypothetical protein